MEEQLLPDFDHISMVTIACFWYWIHDILNFSVTCYLSSFFLERDISSQKGWGLWEECNYQKVVLKEMLGTFTSD